MTTETEARILAFLREITQQRANGTSLKTRQWEEAAALLAVLDVKSTVAK